jgi:phosphatidylglycerophosphatase A
MNLKIKHPNRIPDNPGRNVHPVVRFFASGFFSGYSPYVPGTVGSAAGLILYAIPGFENPLFLCTVIVVTLVLGIFASGTMEERYGHDPSVVTIDEVAGMWISLLFLPKNTIVALAAFFVFRFFDILKPQPACLFDKMQGGVGIMMDDVVAGVYANLLVHLFLFIPFLRQWLLTL